MDCIKCNDCRYANKSKNEEFVFCTYWEDKYNKSGFEGSKEEYVKEVIYADSDDIVVALGWGYPNKHNKVETFWAIKGTVSEGLIYNNMILTSKESYCRSVIKRLKKDLYQY